MRDRTEAELSKYAERRKRSAVKKVQNLKKQLERAEQEAKKHV